MVDFTNPQFILLPSPLNFNLRNVLPRHDHQPDKSLLHVYFHVPAAACSFVPFSGEFDVGCRRLAVLVRHGENDVALRVGAFHLSSEHAAVGCVHVKRAVQEG